MNGESGRVQSAREDGAMTEDRCPATMIATIDGEAVQEVRCSLAAGHLGPDHHAGGEHEWLDKDGTVLAVWSERSLP
jgi:hypothetical protein